MSLTDQGLGDQDSLLLPMIEYLCDLLFMILRLLVLNSVSSGKILMFIWRRRGQDPFQDNVVGETETLGGGSIMVWGCFSQNHKLDLKVV